MESYLLIVLIVTLMCMNFYLISSASEGSTPPNLAFKQCSEVHQISDEVINSIRNRKRIPDDQELKCWLRCVFRKLGMMKGGKVDWGSSMRFTKICQIGEQHQNKTDKVIKICQAQVAQDEKDECELAYSVAVCGIKTWNELGLPEENLDK